MTGFKILAHLETNLPATQETQVGSLGWEDPLEKEMATTPVFLPGKFYGQRRLAGCSPWGRHSICNWMLKEIRKQKPNMCMLRYKD